MQIRALTDIERQEWLRLWRTENVGPIVFRQLLSRFGSAAAALEALPAFGQRGTKRPFGLPTNASIEDELNRTHKIGARVIAVCEPDYPRTLAAIEDAPPLITVLGRLELLHKRSIGIVGARNASLNGRQMSEVLAADL
nr:DNA-processing protein DprA [Pseudomonadota bacterium]